MLPAWGLSPVLTSPLGQNRGQSPVPPLNLFPMCGIAGVIHRSGVGRDLYVGLLSQFADGFRDLATNEMKAYRWIFPPDKRQDSFDEIHHGIAVGAIAHGAHENQFA